MRTRSSCCCFWCLTALTFSLLGIYHWHMGGILKKLQIVTAAGHHSHWLFLGGPASIRFNMLPPIWQTVDVLQSGALPRQADSAVEFLRGLRTFEFGFNQSCWYQLFSGSAAFQSSGGFSRRAISS